MREEESTRFLLAVVDVGSGGVRGVRWDVRRQSSSQHCDHLHVADNIAVELLDGLCLELLGLLGVDLDARILGIHKLL